MILIIFNFSRAPIYLVIFAISKANVLQDFIEIMQIWANRGKKSDFKLYKCRYCLKIADYS